MVSKAVWLFCKSCLREWLLYQSSFNAAEVPYFRHVPWISADNAALVEAFLRKYLTELLTPWPLELRISMLQGITRHDLQGHPCC